MKSSQDSLFLTTILIAILLSSCNVKNEQITLGILLEDMTNPTLLPEFPDPYFTCRQFSSYDRRTVAPDQPGWFANHDASWFVREETKQDRREFVMFDAGGPGAVVRFWMTFGNEQAYTGTMRFYFDGSDTPEIEGPVLKIISGGLLVGEPLSSSVSPLTNYEHRGHNLYLPIPYAKHLKITYECPGLDPVKHSPSVYYNINYRTYETGTHVKSFDQKDLAADLTTIIGLQEKLKANDHSGYQIKKLNYRSGSEGNELKPGQEIRHDIKGPGAIYKLNYMVKAGNLPQALRTTIIRASFDGEETVWSPIGDFFGTGYQIRPYQTWHTQVDSAGNMQCYWVMPYRKNAVLEIINTGDQPVYLWETVSTGHYRWTSRTMHFGAIWREYHGKDAIGYQGDGVNGKHEDLNFTELDGSGIYAGDAITLFNTADAWWGEGDEKVYVDGEKLPSHIGTGTEDYIGYAWCRPEIFSHFLIAQPDGSGNFHPGMTVNMRHRMLDAIPFTTHLKFDLELWHWAATKVNYGVVSYWYMKPGGKCLVEPDPAVVKEPVSLKRENLYPPVPDLAGVLQGEHLRIISLSAGNWEVQTSSTWGWSNNAQLWWIDGGEKGSLKAEFEIPAAGEYTVTGNFTQAADYGDFSLMINDQKAGAIFKGFHTDKEKPVITRLVNLGKFKLNKGINTLQIEITGRDDRAVPRYMVGIDFLRIRND